MTALRKHWILSTFALVLMLAGVGVLFTGALVVGDPPEGGYAVMDDASHDAVMRLHRDIALDPMAMIALNVSAEQAEDVVAEVRAWRESNLQTLASKQADVDAAVLALNVLSKAIAGGTAEEGWQEDLTSAQAGVVTAMTAYDTALNPLRSSVNAMLSESQQITWSAIKTGHGSTMPLRMMALSDAERLTLSAAHQKFELTHAAATSDQERATAVAAWNAAVADILTEGEETIADAFVSQYDTASANVTAAFELVLPTSEG